MYMLFIDDEREPVNDEFVVVRNIVDAQVTIEVRGLPSYISFDHDLGDNQPTGYDFAKWLVEYCMDKNLKMDFDFYVHSQNPVGKLNIENLLNNFKKYST